MYYKEIETPIGTLIAKADNTALHSLLFQKKDNIPNKKSDPNNLDIKLDTHPILDNLEIQLKEYFKEERESFDIPLSPQGTEFQQKVWNALLEIPFGKTRTYLQQSKLLGDALAIRAVASANGKNPIAILIPCHRVIGSDGSLTGYAGGLWRKKYLLEKEGWNAIQPMLF